MKTSELIASLEEAVEMWGDKEISIYPSRYPGANPVERVGFQRLAIWDGERSHDTIMVRGKEK